MRRIFVVSGLLVNAILLLMVNPSFAAESPRLKAPANRMVSPDIMRSMLEARGLNADQLVFKDHTCVINTMSCNSTINSSLTTHDCELNNGTFVDFWEFQGSSGSTVTINLTSSQFDTFLALLDPVPEVVAADDDGGSGTNSRIVHTLNVSGPWTIAANGFSPSDLGDYTLSLNCSGGNPDPPSAPTNLTAMPLSTTEIGLAWRDNSDDETEFRVEARISGGNYQDIGSVPANTEAAVVENLQPGTAYDFRVRARNSAGNSGYSNQASATTPGNVGPCVPSATTLCLNQDRFKVEVAWETADDVGDGQAAPGGTDDSRNLWFFSANNWEMLIKVLDGCAINDRFWVFFAATTDVGFSVTVTDTDTGFVKSYTNALGQPANAVTDTDAFATCP